MAKKCGPSNSAQPDGHHNVLSVTGGSWSVDRMCRIMHSDQYTTDQSVSYSVSVDLYNVNSDVGHVGVMYNVQDLNNFDSVYFR